MNLSINKKQLIDLLQKYVPYNPSEKESVFRMIRFLEQYEKCFERECIDGHVTVSTWLLNQTYDKTLLTHHKKFGSWFQLGGHADGDYNVYRVALKEASEESGLTRFEFLLDSGIFDIDVHFIPQYKDVIAHYHYDVRFLIRTLQQESEIMISDESNDLRWFSFDDPTFPQSSQSLVRMHKKWLTLLLSGWFKN